MFLRSLLLCLIITTSLQAQDNAPYFANGTKVGEATQKSAIVWVRLTEKESADFAKLAIFTEGLAPRENSKLDMPTGILAGTEGQVRITYEIDGAPSQMSDWGSVESKRDYTYQFQLSELLPGKTYRYKIEARKNEGGEVRTTRGQFKTAPEIAKPAPVKFIVSTCQAIRSIDSGKDGHVAYQQMLQFQPDFFVHTGDILYYDKAPFCKSAEQARAKWNMMFAYRHNRDFHQQVTSYFMKDDHDTLKNDCWPGQSYGQLTFKRGLTLFREQVPMGESTFRTIRWGRDVQIWLTENRDFRSDNRAPDGPEKTILGSEQKAWLMESVSESDATYKFVISPGPIVGPDKRGKSDNHSNAAFANEGQQLRDFLSKQANTFVICGDRHWQYCSKDPATGLIEMGCGPINDEHNFGGHPGNNPEFHRYFGARGGFLGITVADGQAKAEWFQADQTGADSKDELPNVLHHEILGR